MRILHLESVVTTRGGQKSAPFFFLARIASDSQHLKFSALADSFYF
jgi:hypothetical protein